MKLLITTQVYENYGAHDWDGKGLCPQYWKAKGGSDYVVRNRTMMHSARPSSIGPSWPMMRSQSLSRAS